MASALYRVYEQTRAALQAVLPQLAGPHLSDIYAGQFPDDTHVHPAFGFRTGTMQHLELDQLLRRGGMSRPDRQLARTVFEDDVLLGWHYWSQAAPNPDVAMFDGAPLLGRPAQLNGAQAHCHSLPPMASLQYAGASMGTSIYRAMTVDHAGDVNLSAMTAQRFQAPGANDEAPERTGLRIGGQVYVVENDWHAAEGRRVNRLAPSDRWLSADGPSRMQFRSLGSVEGLFPGDFHIAMIPVNASVGTMALLPTVRRDGVAELADVADEPAAREIHGRDLAMGAPGMHTPTVVTGLSGDNELERIVEQHLHLGERGGLLPSDFTRAGISRQPAELRIGFGGLR